MRKYNLGFLWFLMKTATMWGMDERKTLKKSVWTLALLFCRMRELN